MKVKLLTSRAGVDFSQNAGDVIDVSEAEGKRMIEAGQAAPIANVVSPEKAIRRGRPAKKAE